MAVAGVIAAGLIIAGLVRGATGAAPGDVPLVDIVSEDQAIAALRLYGAEAFTIDEIRTRADIYAAPGPHDAAQVLVRGADDVKDALEAAQKVPNGDALFSTYVNDDSHPTLRGFFGDDAQLAGKIALLSDTHDTLYSGTGSVPLGEASTRLNNIVADGSTPSPLHDWAIALLEQMEDRNRVQQAAEARAASQHLWASAIQSLEPIGVAELQTYINGLPAVTVDGLRGHPVAGPPLRRLEQQSREVSQ